MDSMVSVVIPTYKRSAEMVRRAIESVRKQTHLNLEVIVVDDNVGTDAAVFRDEIREMIEKIGDSRLLYIQNAENLGGSLARNEGIKRAQGEYVTFLDDDDEYLPRKIEVQLRYMEENSLDMSFTDLRLCSEKGKTVDYREFRMIRNFDQNALLRFHLTRHITGTPTFMYKKEALLKTGGFPDAKMGQEFYLMVNTIRAGIRIGYLPGSGVVAYRHSSGGISSGTNKIEGENALYEFKKKYFEILEKKDRLYIRFRHYVVLAVAYRRNKVYFRMILMALLALAASPADMLSEAAKFPAKLFWLKRGCVRRKGV